MNLADQQWKAGTCYPRFFVHNIYDKPDAAQDARKQLQHDLDDGKPWEEIGPK